MGTAHQLQPLDLTTSIPFADFGRLLTFRFHDVLNVSNAFSIFALDNTIYTNTGTSASCLKTPTLHHGLIPCCLTARPCRG